MQRVSVQDKFAVVDDADLELVSQYNWQCSHGKVIYAQTCVRGKTLKMHNLIMGVVGIDHIDGDGLNNQRSNLRVANQI